MQRLVIYTEDNYISIGVGSRDHFLRCLPADENGEYNTVFEITDLLLSNLNKLSNKHFPSSKENYHQMVYKVLLKNKGKKVFSTNQFIPTPELCEVACNLNKGMNLDDACETYNKNNPDSVQII